LQEIHDAVVCDDAVFTCHKFISISDKERLDPKTAKPCIGSILYTEAVTGSRFSNLSNRLMAVVGNPRLLGESRANVVVSFEEFFRKNVLPNLPEGVQAGSSTASS
jgi:hypothetical protein